MVKKQKKSAVTIRFLLLFLFYRTFTVENGISAFAQCLGVKQFLS
ncbi:hypothetical protein HMPREF9519_01021 [Enterococcus faecalis TX1346]|nr:hypothetical protein HMPREF9519_01021 [Enterococcus faecalis TX1346]